MSKERLLSYFLMGLGIFLIGFSPSITGLIVGENFSKFFGSVLGLVLVISGIILFLSKSSLEEKVFDSGIDVSENIVDSYLLRAVKNIRNEDIKRELDHLYKELSKGNFEAGIGKLGHIKGDTRVSINYLRGRNGGRLYYYRTGKNSYEVIGKSDKNNQDSVIYRLIEIYKR